MHLSSGHWTRSWWARAGLVFAVWTFLGLFEASHSGLRYAVEGDQVAWYRILALGLALWYAWALLALLIFPLARRFPIDARNWPWRLPLLLAAGAGFAAAKLALDYPIIMLLYCPAPDWMPFGRFFAMAFTGYFHKYMLIYAGIIGVAHILDYYRKYRERELRASQLEARLAQAQLQVLKMQLHPHFLFNTLNAISALMHRDVAVADRMLARLGEMLRTALEHVGTQEVSLGEELEFIRPYLEIEQARFGPRLSVRMDIDPEAMDARVPNLILQPLVENAIRHGIGSRPGPGHIEIQARRQESTLHLRVSDDGPGLPSAEPDGVKEGVGLSNTRARLRQLYGPEHCFELANAPGGGFVVSMVLPYREAS